MEGYPQISQLMQQHSELAIFRKFGDLNMLSLLHLQAEIMHLEENYHKLSKSDKESSSRAYRSQDWWSLTQLDCDGKREQWDALCELRKKLREYSRCILTPPFADCHKIKSTYRIIDQFHGKRHRALHPSLHREPAEAQPV
jgi:hypothetical protein